MAPHRLSDKPSNIHHYQTVGRDSREARKCRDDTRKHSSRWHKNCKLEDALYRLTRGGYGKSITRLKQNLHSSTSNSPYSGKASIHAGPQYSSLGSSDQPLLASTQSSSTGLQYRADYGFSFYRTLDGYLSPSDMSIIPAEDYTKYKGCNKLADNELGLDQEHDLTMSTEKVLPGQDLVNTISKKDCSEVTFPYHVRHDRSLLMPTNGHVAIEWRINWRQFLAFPVTLLQAHSDSRPKSVLFTLMGEKAQRSLWQAPTSRLLTSTPKTCKSSPVKVPVQGADHPYHHSVTTYGQSATWGMHSPPDPSNSYSISWTGQQPQRSIHLPLQLQSSGQQSKSVSDQDAIYPCICHLWELYSLSDRRKVQDPTPHCSTKQRYISQLDVHHSCVAHGGFRCCTNCFESTRTGGRPLLPAQHRPTRRAEYVCRPKCVTPRCNNYWRIPPYETACTHGTRNAPVASWQASFRIFHGLSRDDWVPDPKYRLQQPPDNLPSHHPMAGLYHPEWPPLSLHQIHQPPVSQQPQPLAPQQYQPWNPSQRSQITQSTRNHNPSQHVPTVFATGEDLLTNLERQPPVTDAIRQRIQSLENIALGFWQVVNAAEPAWNQLTEITHNMYMCLDWSSPQLPSTRVRELEALLTQYCNIITKPRHRTMAVWRDVLRWTSTLLDVEGPDLCPWNQLENLAVNPSTTYMASLAGPSRRAQAPANLAQAPQFQQVSAYSDPTPQTYGVPIPAMIDLQQYTAGRNPDSNPRAVMVTFDPMPRQHEHLIVAPRQLSNRDPSISHLRSLSRESALSEGPQFSHSGSGSGSFHYVSTPSRSQNRFVISGAASPAFGPVSGGAHSVPEEAIDDRSEYDEGDSQQ